jgi:flagellar basal body-associated protein FliL
MFDVGCSMFDVPHSRSAASPRSERGMALVITLIMLSVTLVMAVAFLALAKRERGSVTTAAETTTARLAADSALSAAQAQIAANLLTTPAAAYNFGLLVSTNYYNSYGFVPGISNPTNVNYFDNSGNLLAGDNLIQNIANLYLSPRAPVFVTTNAGSPLDFRFYLDLNENGRFESTGYQPIISPDAVYQWYDTNGNITKDFAPPNILSNSVVGDPEWIGVLARPDQPHSADNPFVARYAFFAQPIGNSLDLNYIYNQASSKKVNPLANGNDGFMRNQGVGSWEINLAAFLADLNTNEWNNPLQQPYQYYEPGNPNNGYAFEDALSMLSYRYAGVYGSLASANSLFPNALNIFPYDNIDEYSDGPLQTTTTNINETLNSLSDGDRNLSDSWAGADNTNHFFALPSELFDPTKSSGGLTGGFTNRLHDAGNGLSTYDRYTYYRMLAQLGTDSSPDDGKLNLNYSNAVVTYYTNNGVVLPARVSVVVGAETNLVPWAPINFFTAAADRMLKLYTTNWFQSSPSNYLWTYYGIATNYVYQDSSGNWITNDPSGRGLVGTFGTPNVFGLTSDGIPAFGITNIPVLVNSNFVYSPAVNRLLQLAANFYDATTNGNYNLPHVFRPVFEHDYYGNVFIVGYLPVTYVSGTGDAQLAAALPVSALPNLGNNGTPIMNSGFLVNAFGVPWIIGAKKGLPGFNQFYMNNIVQVTRKLEMSRVAPGDRPNQTNQMYLFNFANNMGLTFWNSYKTNYPRTVNIYAVDSLYMCLTNASGTIVWPSSGVPSSNNFVFATNVVLWPGSQWTNNPPAATLNSGSFVTTNWTYTFMPTAVYRFYSGTSFDTNTSATNYWQTTTPPLPPLPQFGLVTTNYLQAVILDGNNVIDYVQLGGPVSNRNLNQEINDQNNTGEGMWNTNVNKKYLAHGLDNQITVSMSGTNLPVLNSWQPAQNFPAGTIANQAIFFNHFVLGSDPTNQELTLQAPYTPSRTVYQAIIYQANDPLVHYLINDLNYVDPGTIGLHLTDDLKSNPVTTPSLNSQGKRYQPWGLNPQMANLGSVDINAYNLAYKDPQVWGSDYWDFPTNQYPTVGWIGRVHRGTPWQTVDLKATNILLELSGNASIGYKTWADWTGDDQISGNQYFDAINSAPVQDRMLFDLFTTRLNDNAVRGALSVNQTNLAAWSALFSGMQVLSNTVSATAAQQFAVLTTTNLTIDPAGVDVADSGVGKIVSVINNTLTNINLFPLQVFAHVGDILAVPALTEQSPFINNTSGTTKTSGRTGVSVSYSEPAFGISDEVYEWLPQQMMGLVRCSTTPRYVVYCYGQTLKPAPNGVVTSSTYFGLCTNYQVTAESVVRAVVRVDQHATPTGTNYSAVVESYNVLPSN